MTRSLKALGLTGVVLITSVAVASGASAQLVTSDGSFFKVGTELAEGNAFLYPGLPEIKCTGSHFRGGAIGSTPHSPLSSGYSKFTVTPTYTGCKAGIFPMTVKMTTCDFRGELGETTGGGDTYGQKISLECTTAGDSVHMEIYSNAAHTNLICSITLGAQTPTSAIHVTDTTNGSIRVHGALTGIHATRTNFGGCPPSGTSNAVEYKVNVEGTGENLGGAPTAVSLSH
jgi:hypothetical protein